MGEREQKRRTDAKVLNIILQPFDRYSTDYTMYNQYTSVHISILVECCTTTLEHVTVQALNMISFRQLQCAASESDVDFADASTG